MGLLYLYVLLICVTGLVNPRAIVRPEGTSMMRLVLLMHTQLALYLFIYFEFLLLHNLYYFPVWRGHSFPFYSIYKQILKWFPSCRFLPHVFDSVSRIVRFAINNKNSGHYLKPLFLTTLTYSFSCYTYHKDERAKRGNLVTTWRSFSYPPLQHTHTQTHTQRLSRLLPLPPPSTLPLLFLSSLSPLLPPHAPLHLRSKRFQSYQPKHKNLSKPRSDTCMYQPYTPCQKEKHFLYHLSISVANTTRSFCFCLP
jgi:hypothetical protein